MEARMHQGPNAAQGAAVRPRCCTLVELASLRLTLPAAGLPGNPMFKDPPLQCVPGDERDEVLGAALGLALAEHLAGADIEGRE